MPTYEYRCDKCGKQFEIVQSFKDRPLRRHRECGGDLEKVFHSRGVVFKGSGFYVTDSRPKSSEGVKNGTSDSTPKEDSKDASKPKTETAPATAPASKSDSAD